MKSVRAVALLLAASSGPALAQGQLPRGVVPLSYDISVNPGRQGADVQRA